MAILATTTAFGCGDETPPAQTPFSVTSYDEAETRSDFTWILEEVIHPSCSTQTACHQGASRTETLNLLPEVAYESLLTQLSEQQPHLAHVEPGAADRSYLIIKMVGAQNMLEGPMPVGDDAALCDAKIDAVARWIDAGAPDD